MAKIDLFFKELLLLRFAVRPNRLIAILSTIYENQKTDRRLC